MGEREVCIFVGRKPTECTPCKYTCYLRLLLIYTGCSHPLFTEDFPSPRLPTAYTPEHRLLATILPHSPTSTFLRHLILPQQPHLPQPSRICFRPKAWFRSGSAQHLAPQGPRSRADKPSAQIWPTHTTSKRDISGLAGQLICLGDQTCTSEVKARPSHRTNLLEPRTEHVKKKWDLKHLLIYLRACLYTKLT